MDQVRAPLKGLTLIEMLVAAALFLGMTTVLLAFLHSSRNMESKSDAEADAYRAVLAASGHLKQELRGAKVLAPALYDPAAATLRYQKPEVDDGRLTVDANGRPTWEPESVISVDTQQSLILIGADGSTRTLARLGNAGSVTFERTRPDVVTAVVIARHTDAEGRPLKEGSFQLTTSFFLPNE